MIEFMRWQDPADSDRRARFISVDPAGIDVVIENDLKDGYVIENDLKDGYVTIVMKSGFIVDVVGAYRNILEKVEAGR